MFEYQYELYKNAIISFMKILNMDSPQSVKRSQKVWAVPYSKAKKVVREWKMKYR